MAAAAFLLTLLACAGGAIGTAPVAPRGVPGFDTRDYPGDEVMRAWHDASPYRWVGYYLPAPCHTGTSWQAKRDALRELGYGFAIIFVGEQDWPETADTTAPPADARCTQANLTAARGAVDGAAAASAAATEGFPREAVVYLDVERVDRVSTGLSTYVREWTRALLRDGRYRPGLYAHDVNVPALYAVQEAEYAAAGRTDRPSLWVAKPAGFELAAAPSESGYPVAEIWQGRLDTRESWGGHALPLDVNVATSGDPSRGR